MRPKRSRSDSEEEQIWLGGVDRIEEGSSSPRRADRAEAGLTEPIWADRVRRGQFGSEEGLTELRHTETKARQIVGAEKVRDRGRVEI